MELTAVMETSNEKRNSYKEQAISRLGETRMNANGSLMTIDEYNNSADITVRFLDNDYMVHTTWQAFIHGNVKNPSDKSVMGKGCIGIGDYSMSIKGKTTPQYTAWSSMMMRCYSKQFHEKHPSYIGCTVSEEWLNFQNFAKWYDENYYEVEGSKMNLDKDIICKGNRIYSPQNCCYVPKLINTLFIKGDVSRGAFPLGVRLKHGKYEAQCRTTYGKREYLGLHDTPELAFEAYRKFKEQLIKDAAETLRDDIPANLYEAMMEYKVEITD